MPYRTIGGSFTESVRLSFRSAAAAAQDVENAEWKRAHAAREAFEATHARVESELQEAAAAARLAEAERAAAQAVQVRQRQCELAAEAARGRAAAESQLAQLEEERRQRAEQAEAELRDRATIAQAALEAAANADVRSSGDAVVPRVAAAESAPPVRRAAAAPWHNWFELIRPHGAAGAGATAMLALAVFWIGLQSTPQAPVAAAGSAVVTPASDADIEPALKRSETLASLDRLEADGAWVMR